MTVMIVCESVTYGNRYENTEIDMKIGLLGAPSTGKTTLAFALSKELSLPVIGDSYDEIIAYCTEEYPFEITKYDEESFPDYFERLWLEHRYSEINRFEWGFHKVVFSKEDNLRNFITESPGPARAIGCLLYCLHIAQEEWITSKVVQAMHRHYDLLVYLPPVLPLENDGRRPINTQLVDAIDIMIRGTIAKHRLKVTVLYETELSQRVNHVMTVIKNDIHIKERS
jgi:nicotinamide riboside kinase